MTHAVRKIGLVLSVLVMVPLLVSAADKTDPKKRTTYKQDEVLTAAENFFGKGAKGIAEVIQKAFDAGVTQGADMIIEVRGEPVCGYCRGDIPAAAQRAGLNSLTVICPERGKLQWRPGQRSLW